MKALEKLTGDDSKRVAAAAARLFGDVPAARSTAPVPSTPLSESSLPDVIKDALVKPPDVVPEPERTVTPLPVTFKTTTAAEPPSRRPGETVTTPPPQVLSPNVIPSTVLSSQALAPNVPGPRVETAPVVAAPSGSAVPSAQATPPDGALWGSTTTPSARPRTEAMWGPATGVAAPSAVNPQSTAARHQLPWSGRRAAARAAIGTWVGFAMFVAALGYGDEILELGSVAVISIAAIIVTAIVSVAERLVSAVQNPRRSRVPRGRRQTDGSRRGSSGGLSASWPTSSSPDWSSTSQGLGIVSFAAGFLIAEALVGRRLGRHGSAEARPA